MSERSGPIMGMLVIVVALVIWVASVGHSPATRATPITTTKPGTHAAVTTDQASQLGASLGDWLRRIMGGDQAATPTTTTRRHR